MNANVPGTDVLWTVLTAVGFVLVLCCAASWLIDNALLPALRGLAGPLLRPWAERKWPAEGRHTADWRPLDEEEDDGAEGGTARPVPVVRPQERPGERVGAGAPGSGRLVDAVQPVRGRPAEEPVQRAAADAEADPGDDLITGEDYDTDTLRIFHDAAQEHLVPTNEPRECPECGCPVRPAAAECPECGAEIADPEDPPGPDDLPSPPGGDVTGDADTTTGTGPGDLDALDLLIERARQRTTADPMLLPMIRERLGFDSVDCYIDAMRRKLTTAGAG